MLLLASGLAACGSGRPTAATASSAASHVSTNPVLAAKLDAKRKARAAARAHKRAAASHQHHTSSSSNRSHSTTTSNGSTTTSSGGSGGGGSATSTSNGSPTPRHSHSTKPKSSGHTTTVPTVAALPGPTVSQSSGGLRASLHGVSHSPKVGKQWDYSVLATDAGRHALAGTVETEFALGGQVVGRETPPTHPLKNGRLNDNVTFPAQAAGIPLTFQIVVHTNLGSATLDWPIKVQK